MTTPKNPKITQPQKTATPELEAALNMLPHLRKLDNETQQLKALRLLGEILWENKALSVSSYHC